MADVLRHHIVPWFDETDGLTDAQYRVFHVVYQMTHLHEEALTLHARGLAGRCNMTIRKFESALAGLVACGKILIVDGRISLARTSFTDATACDFERVPGDWLTRRALVFERDGLICAYCGDDEEGPFEVDHVHPRSRGGSHDLENLCVACRPCNRGKSDRSAAEWRAILAARTSFDVSQQPPGGVQ